MDGFTKKAILIYYFPAVVANAIKAAKDFHKGLKYALERVAEVFEKTRKKLDIDGLTDSPGVYTENVAELARDVTKAQFPM